jgi:hypothetical protein
LRYAVSKPAHGLARRLGPAYSDEPLGHALARLVKAYPDFIDSIQGNELVWKDGTRMSIDDGHGAKAFEAMLDQPDIKDMFAIDLSHER